MAIFIPERVGVSNARGIQIKRTLGALDDDHVVRTPMRRDAWLPDFFVQHREKGWLAIAVADIPFSPLASDQLLANEARASFEKLLADFQAFPGLPGTDRNTLGKIVLMWKCNQDEVRTIRTQYLARFGIRLFSRAQFLELGAKITSGTLVRMDAEMEEAFISCYFPESEIHPTCTTRRHFHRDNTARLHRYFLDHQQEWAAKLDLEPLPQQSEAAKDFSIRLINGVAGSGKTLIALSRAHILAELHPDQRILVLIHNTPVVADINAKLARTKGAPPPNLKIETFFAWAHRQWRNLYKRRLDLAATPEVEDLIAHFRSRWLELTPSDAQLRMELDFINESLISDLQQYRNADRTGRGFALRSKERAAIWELFQTLSSTLRRNGQRLWSAVPHEICLAPEHSALEKYEHILIDEAQFFAPSWFQAVRLALAEHGSLFLCADPNQGFMKSRLSWRSVGLEVAGRTKKLRRSYRTTQAILSAATRILQQVTKGNSDDYLVPELSGMEAGVKPFLIHTDSPQDSMDRLINELSTGIEKQTMALGDLLVIYGENVSKQLLYKRLCDRFKSENVWWFNMREQRKAPPNGYEREYLRMANLDTATGLEAGIVFLIGVENLLSCFDQSNQASEMQAAETEEKARKLYMAMTRAGRVLVMLSSQKVPACIEDCFLFLDEVQEKI